MNNFAKLESATLEQRERLLTTPIILDAFEGRVGLHSYRMYLEQAWHHVRHTVPLLMACGSRLPRRLAWLQKDLVRYIDEEHGHDEWILGDIAASGGDTEAVKAGRPALATELMISYAYDSINRGNPASLFGMIFVLEMTSAAIATEAAQHLAVALQLSREAFTYLRSHGRVDQEHVGDLARIVNRLDEDADLPAVIHMAQVMYELYRGMFESLPRVNLSSVELHQAKEIA